MQPLL